MPSARLFLLGSALATITRTSNSKKKNDEVHSFSSSSSSSIAAGVQQHRGNSSRRPMAADASNNKGFLPFLGKVRILHRLFAVCHVGLLGVATWGAVLAVRMCPGEVSIACFIAAAASAIRLLWMVGSAVSQAAVASTMLAQGLDPPCISSSTITSAEKQTPSMRKKRRMWYVRWLWWGRFGAFVTLLQLVGAANLTFSFVKNASTSTNRCYSADDLGGWHRGLFLALVLAAWVLTVMQCCMGSDILAWSSLYARHSEAWRAYYHEMFDYGIREALCCLGRAQYITRDEDEVDSVAAVLGDLVSYRAAGASHLEFLAGLALLQLQGPPQPTADQYPPAPTSLVEEATVLHSYAVAAYTGPLLDLGRNPLLFPCVWLHRQGVLTPWNRNRRPTLEGDNWWRGHAAAFLRHSKLPPEALRKGRVHQAKRECAYFVTVVHQLRCVVVAVRGTETPEDLLTDGLGRESMLMESDMCGLLQSEKISKALKQNLLSTKPHFAHEGIIEAARELALQLDYVSENETESSSTSIDINGLGVLTEDMATSQKESGILASLLGPGGECEGYALRFVGHSLGGSIAALTAVRLYARYPQLHVYGYGVLPCLDASTADACSSFITSIVYNDEFSSRLSVSSIKRLRVAAVKALASETSSDSGTITRLAWQLFGPEKPADSLPIGRFSNLEFTEEVTVASRPNKLKGRQLKFRLKGGIYLCSHACRCMIYMSSYSSARGTNIELCDLTQFRSHDGELCQLVEKGTYQQAALGVFPRVESNSIDDQVADTENVCLDAGRDSDYDGVPEESEVLVVNVDSGGISKAEQVKSEENGECHHHTIGEVCHTHEIIHKGKAPMNCDSASESPMNPIVCANLLEEDNHCEMFMPGLIVHVVPVNKASSWQLWQGWGKKAQQNYQHQAFIKDTKSFQDIVISPSMFLDHMPWRCQYALNSVLEHVKATMQVADECTDSLV